MFSFRFLNCIPIIFSEFVALSISKNVLLSEISYNACEYKQNVQLLRISVLTNEEINMTALVWLQANCFVFYGNTSVIAASFGTYQMLLYG